MAWIASTMVLVVVLAALLGGCTGGGTGQAASSVHVPPKPAAPDYRTPQSTVRSYLAWVTYAYRIANSDVASPTAGDDEGVRVDSYLEKNKEESKRLDQTLLSITFGRQSVEGTHTLVPTHEQWKYRYLQLTSDTPVSPYYNVTYDATYTVDLARGHLVVDSVDAKAYGEVK